MDKNGSGAQTIHLGPRELRYGESYGHAKFKKYLQSPVLPWASREHKVTAFWQSDFAASADHAGGAVAAVEEMCRALWAGSGFGGSLRHITPRSMFGALTGHWGYIGLVYCDCLAQMCGALKPKEMHLVDIPLSFLSTLTDAENNHFLNVAEKCLVEYFHGMGFSSG